MKEIETETATIIIESDCENTVDESLVAVIAAAVCYMSERERIQARVTRSAFTQRPALLAEVPEADFDELMDIGRRLADLELGLGLMSGDNWVWYEDGILKASSDDLAALEYKMTPWDVSTSYIAKSRQEILQVQKAGTLTLQGIQFIPHKSVDWCARFVLVTSAATRNQVFERIRPPHRGGD